jgi:hypothetical protein
MATFRFVYLDVSDDMVLAVTDCGDFWVRAATAHNFSVRGARQIGHILRAMSIEWRDEIQY